MRNGILFLLFLCSGWMSLYATGTNDEPDSEQDLWKRYHHAEGKKKEQADMLLKLVQLRYQLGDEKGKDSLFDLAIEKYKSLNEHELIVKAYEVYLDCASDYMDRNRYLRQAQNLLQYANSCHEDHCMAKAHSTLASAYLYTGRLQEAIEEGNQAYQYAVKVKQDPFLEFDCLLILGNAYKQSEQKKKEAFEKYWDASLLAYKIENDSLLAESYSHLSDFYFDIENYDSARSFKLKQYQLLLRHPNDSVPLMRTWMGMASVEFALNLPNEAGEKLREVIRFAEQHQIEVLKDNAFQFFRSHFMAQEDPKGLFALYQRFPEELEHVRQSDTPAYYRIMALVWDAKGPPDSAHRYYQLAMQAQRESNQYLLAQMEFLYAGFLCRQQLGTEAIQILTHLNEQYDAGMDELFWSKVTHRLNSLYSSRHQMDSAYKYRCLYEEHREQWTAMTHNDELLWQGILKE